MGAKLYILILTLVLVLITMGFSIAGWNNTKSTPAPTPPPGLGATDPYQECQDTSSCLISQSMPVTIKCGGNTCSNSSEWCVSETGDHLLWKCNGTEWQSMTQSLPTPLAGYTTDCPGSTCFSNQTGFLCRTSTFYSCHDQKWVRETYLNTNLKKALDAAAAAAKHKQCEYCLEKFSRNDCALVC